MPYSVEQLIENHGTVTVIQDTDAISAALDLMIERDFSQLPVVDEHGLLRGMVTYESILRAARSFNTKPDLLFVRDAMVRAPVHYREDDLFDLLDELKATNAVVIVEPEGCVSGIVTAYDVSGFLRNRTEDLMHIEDIEFIIKQLIKRTPAYEKENAGLDEFQMAAAKPSVREGKESNAKKPKPFDELNLGDYINLLMSRSIWKFCAPILNVEKESLYELLVRIRQTRNDLAHFRSEISPRSREELKYCAHWLRGRYQEYEKQQGGNLIDTLLQQGEQKEIVRAAREEATSYSIEDHAGARAGRRTIHSRYAALANWLAEQKQEQFLFSFEQIEEIIQSPLPASARALRAWWANDRIGHYHSILWLEAGWRVVYVDLGAEQVIFARI